MSLTLLCLFQLSSQQITGKVVDVDNIPLIGASILEAGTSNGTITDLDGNFTLTLTGGGDLIQVSYTGYQARDVVVIPGQPIEVMLAEGISLDEVVVTALGISREKKGLTYAVDEIDSKELTTVKRANVVNSLAGKAAGVFINKSGTGVGGSARVLLRGNKSLSNNQPLYVIDGIPMTNNNTGQQDGVFGGGIDGGDGISNINPEDIESMSILKRASAAALYGSKAANGDADRFVSSLRTPVGQERRRDTLGTLTLGSSN